MTPAHETDPFDAPLPNELYQEGEEGHLDGQGEATMGQAAGAQAGQEGQ